MTKYEMTEIALTLMASDWKAEDRELFIEVNAEQGDENRLSVNEIEAIFDIIAEKEGEDNEEV